MVRTAVLALGLLAGALLACRKNDSSDPRSQADAQLALCRMGAAIQKDSTAATNCELQASRAYADIEHQETLQAVKDERQEQKDEEELRKARAAEQAKAAKLTALRQAPSSPELGATTMECKDTCTSMDGELRVTRGDEVLVSCLVGGELVWVVGVEPGQGSFIASRVKAFYESADALKLRANVETKLGPADSVEIVKDHRVWTWTKENLIVMVGSYPDGAFVSTAVPTKASPQADAE